MVNNQQPEREDEFSCDQRKTSTDSETSAERTQKLDQNLENLLLNAKYIRYVEFCLVGTVEKSEIYCIYTGGYFHEARTSVKCHQIKSSFHVIKKKNKDHQIYR